MQVFLAYSFREQDRDLVADVERLLGSHNIRVTTGEYLAGEQLTPAVQERIKNADGLVALLTRREEIVGGGWKTHDWVINELNYARNNDIPAIPLVEKDVAIGGMYGDHERIDFDRDKPLAAFLHLSNTVAQWKRGGGGVLILQIQPDDLALQVGLGNGDIQCKYRIKREGETSDWQDTIPLPDVGGTFVEVGVQDEASIQLMIEFQATRWVSGFTTPWPQIQLKKLGGNG